MITVELHICAITEDGKLWHASRPRGDKSGSVDAWGPWSAWEEVKPQGASVVGSFSSVDCGVVLKEVNFEGVEEFHVCGLTRDGRLLHTSRILPGDWQPFEDLKTRIKADWAGFEVRDIKLGRSLNDVCILALRKKDARRQVLLTGFHQFDGTWADAQDVNDANLAGFPGSFLSFGCASVSPELLFTELHVCGRTHDGTVWHTLRSSLDGSWLPFAEVQAASSNAPGHIENVCIAEGDTDLHVFVQAAGEIWHTVRFSNPPDWQPSFDHIEDQAGKPGAFGSISSANVDGGLHLCGVTSDGKLWHTLRSISTPHQWQPFEDVTVAGGGNPGKFVSVSTAVFFIAPGLSGADQTCDQIKQGIANDRQQIRMLERRNPHDPAIARRKQDISRLQNRGKHHPCPPQYYQ